MRMLRAAVVASICALLAPVRPPGVPALASNVAGTAVEKCGRVFTFSGYQWCALRGTQDDPDDPDRFSDAPENVFVDGAGKLHLQITRRGGIWYSSEVESLASLGYGRYKFDVEGAIGAMDPNVVAGLFTWSDDPSYHDREFDFEFSRWGGKPQPSKPEPNAQFAVQPYQAPYHLVRFKMAPWLTKTTSTFTWRSRSVDFTVYDGIGTGKIVAHGRLTRDIPPDGGDVRAHMNLWLRANLPPRQGRSAELVIDRFTFDRSP